MEDVLLMDAAERFAKGEMSKEEQIYFEDLRKNNPELDQAVVEQLFFLNQLDNYSSSRNFRNLLHEVETKMIAEKVVSRKTEPTLGKAKVIELWHKYKRTVAVAASIAGFVSIFMSGIVSSVSNADTSLKPLVDKLTAQEKKTKSIEKKLIELQVNAAAAPVKFDASFRATGFLVDAANNFIVTNAHVVKEASHHLIIENNKGEQYTAKSIWVNAADDIALIQIIDSNFKKLPALPYNIRKRNAEIGEQIFMIGYPKPELVYSEGYVSAKNGYQMDTSFCQINTTATAGNSGSPIITKNGDVIGIVSSAQTNTSGVIFASKSVNIFSSITAMNAADENLKIKVNAAPSLKGLDRESQIKKMQAYVFMVKGN
jgi:serine protease Do